MIKWLKKRLSEATTYLGIGVVTQGIMILTKADPQHAEVVTATIEQAAAPLSEGDFMAAVTIAITGLLGVLLREKAT